MNDKNYIKKNGGTDKLLGKHLTNTETFDGDKCSIYGLNLWEDYTHIYIHMYIFNNTNLRMQHNIYIQI